LASIRGFVFESVSSFILAICCLISGKLLILNSV
jgi:hypothetical protein